MSKIYAFCGRKRSGKGVLAEIVKENTNGVIVTIANYLKNICCEILDCPLDELNKIKDDGTTFFLRPTPRWFEIISKHTGIDKQLIRKKIRRIDFTNVRQMLQVIGTDCIREYNSNWHVDCMVKDIQKYLEEGKTIAIDDVRFPNEKEAIEKLGGECFFIIRPLTDNVSNHSSETSLTWDMFDDNHVIINNDTLDNFKKRFTEYVNDNKTKLPLFLSEMPYFLKLNCLFGKELTPTVKKVMRQNKCYNLFKKYGVFRFKPGSPEEFADFIKEVYGITVTDNKNIKHIFYKVYNPVIVENLKIYIDDKE